MKNPVRIILAFVLAFSMISLSVNAQQSLKSEKNKKFLMQFPADWTLDETGLNGTQFIAFAPVDDAQDMFKENINLVVQDISAYEGITLQQLGEAGDEYLKNVIKDFTIISTDIRSMDGIDYLDKVYTGKLNGMDLKWNQKTFVIDGQAYTLSLTTQIAKFDEYYEIADPIMKRFAIKSN